MAVGARKETDRRVTKVWNEINSSNTTIDQERMTHQKTDIQPKFIVDYIKKFGDSDFEYCSDCSANPNINYENSIGDDTKLNASVLRK